MTENHLTILMIRKEKEEFKCEKRCSDMLSAIATKRDLLWKVLPVTIKFHKIKKLILRS